MPCPYDYQQFVCVTIALRLGKMASMKRTIQVFKSFADAEKADKAYYRFAYSTNGWTCWWS
jgi:hypothetical protein